MAKEQNQSLKEQYLDEFTNNLKAHQRDMDRFGRKPRTNTRNFETIQCLYPKPRKTGQFASKQEQK